MWSPMYADFLGVQFSALSTQHSTIVDCAGASQHLRAHGARLRLYGIHFTGGQSSSDGGSLFLNSSHADLVGCRISNSSARDGGAIFAWGGSLQADNCTFAANVAAGSGGAISMHKAATAVVRNCSFDSCRASSLGGAISLFTSSSMHLTDIAVRDSRAGQIGGGIYHGGAGLLLNSGKFEQCSAESGGAFGFTSPIRVSGPLRISACEALRGDGGGFYGVGGSARIHVEAQNFLVEKCSAWRNGGGISLHYGAQISVWQPAAGPLSLRRNRAGTFGGGIFKEGCDTGLDLKVRSLPFLLLSMSANSRMYVQNVCWIGNVDVDRHHPSPVVKFDLNEAQVAGGGTCIIVDRI